MSLLSMTFVKAIIIFTTILAHRHNVGLISVPAGRFVADALLSLQKTFVVAVATLSHR